MLTWRNFELIGFLAAPLLSVSRYEALDCLNPRSFRMDLMAMALVAAEHAETWRERRVRAVRRSLTAGFEVLRAAKTLAQWKPCKPWGVLDQAGAHLVAHMHSSRSAALERALYSLSVLDRAVTRWSLE